MTVYQPDELVASCVLAVMVGPFIWLMIVRWAYGDPPPWKRIGQLAIIAAAVAVASYSQSQPLKAQQDHEMRLRELERRQGDMQGQINVHEGVQSQINQQVLSNLERMENRLIAHEREEAEKRVELRNEIVPKVNANTESRTRFEFIPAVIQGLVTLVAVIGGVLGIDFIKRRNGHANGGHK